MRGALRTSRTRGGMRWTRKLRRTSAAEADGEVVWSWRRDAGVKFVRSKLLAGDGGKKAVHRGEREVSRKPLRGESRVVSAHLWSFPCAFCAQSAAQGAAGASRHPAFPAPSSVWEGYQLQNLGRIAPRDRGGVVVSPSLRAQRSNPSRRSKERMDCFAALAMTVIKPAGQISEA
jgi:hypothetical protein